jgi:hypothetical protein
MPRFGVICSERTARNHWDEKPASFTRFLIHWGGSPLEPWRFGVTRDDVLIFQPYIGVPIRSFVLSLCMASNRSYPLRSPITTFARRGVRRFVDRLAFLFL